MDNQASPWSVVFGPAIGLVGVLVGALLGSLLTRNARREDEMRGWAISLRRVATAATFDLNEFSALVKIPRTTGLTRDELTRWGHERWLKEWRAAEDDFLLYVEILPFIPPELKLRSIVAWGAIKTDPAQQSIKQTEAAIVELTAVLSDIAVRADEFLGLATLRRLVAARKEGEKVGSENVTPTLVMKIARWYVDAVDRLGPLGVIEFVVGLLRGGLRRRERFEADESAVDVYVLAMLGLLVLVAWSVALWPRALVLSSGIGALWVVLEVLGKLARPVVVCSLEGTYSPARSLLLAFVNFVQVGVAFGVIYFAMASQMGGFVTATDQSPFVDGGSAAFASLAEQFGRQLDARPVTTLAGAALLFHGVAWIFVLVVAVGTFVNRLAVPRLR